MTAGYIEAAYMTAYWKRKRPYLDTCETKITFHYRVRSLCALHNLYPIGLVKTHNIFGKVEDINL